MVHHWNKHPLTGVLVNKTLFKTVPVIKNRVKTSEYCKVGKILNAVPKSCHKIYLPTYSNGLTVLTMLLNNFDFQKLKQTLTEVKKPNRICWTEGLDLVRAIYAVQ